MTYKTDQENFWANDFGSDYKRRNKGADTVASNTALFANAFRRIRKLESVIELGANIGLNLRATRTLFPKAILSAVEINANAVKELEDHISKDNDPYWGKGVPFFHSRMAASSHLRSRFD